MNRATNRFYLHRKEIDRISRERHVDVGVASSMIAAEKKWTGYTREMNEWMNECRKFTLAKDKTLADLFKE